MHKHGPCVAGCLIKEGHFLFFQFPPSPTFLLHSFLRVGIVVLTTQWFFVSAHCCSDCMDVYIVASMVHCLSCISTGNDGGREGSVCCLLNYHMHLSHPLYHSDPPICARHSIVRIYVPLRVRSFIDISLRCQLQMTCSEDLDSPTMRWRLSGVVPSVVVSALDLKFALVVILMLYEVLTWGIWILNLCCTNGH